MNPVYICEDCGTGWTSEAAAERCDCGAEDRYFSPSRSRISYLPGDD